MLISYYTPSFIGRDFICKKLGVRLNAHGYEKALHRYFPLAAIQCAFYCKSLQLVFAYEPDYHAAAHKFYIVGSKHRSLQCFGSPELISPVNDIHLLSEA